MGRARRGVHLALVAAVAALTACSSGGDLTVMMASEHEFEPASLTVAAGETVRFINDGGEAHTVTAYEEGIPEDGAYFASGGFDSERDARRHVSEGLITTGTVYEVTFDQPGTYEYFCIPHEAHGMKGTVVVEPR